MLLESTVLQSLTISDRPIWIASLLQHGSHNLKSVGATMRHQRTGRRADRPRNIFLFMCLYFHASRIRKKHTSSHVSLHSSQIHSTDCRHKTHAIKMVMGRRTASVLTAFLFVLAIVGGQRYEQGYDDYSQDNLYHDYAIKQQEKEVGKG